MAALEIQSNLKCITSGNAPTTTELANSEFAFGLVGGAPKLYGNVNGTIVDFSVDADTLISLLLGGNGIEIAKNTAGDKVKVSVSLPIVFSAASPGPGSDATVIDATYTDGYPGRSMIKLKYGDYVISLSPLLMSLSYPNNGRTCKLELRGTGITYIDNGNEYAILRQDNVKTINGQSIYGTGDVSVGGGKSYKHYLEIEFIHNTSSDAATIYMTDINYVSGDISEAGGFVNACFPVQESPTYSPKYHEATGFYNSTPIVAIKYTGSKIYAVTTTSEKEITPSIGMWLITDYVVDVSTNMKPVTA